MMFETYSERSRQVIFLARARAGHRGADMLGIDDILAALVLEDQGLLQKAVYEALPLQLQAVPVSRQTEPHRPFFPADTARDLLQRMEVVLPQSKPIPPGVDMPISPDVEQTFRLATDLMTRLQHGHVDPLHLLAAALATESSEGVQILRQSGVTEEKVIEAIRAEGRV